ncbi:hypothetical protein CERSUDRAFT_118469 [Gelatoporia subvermispora B]|uniref:MYND-type domain-containing protein n=1 Tax=Ceriporiopsis subvermispora (strain B) TaxID=914234 RepID=M2QKR1_CERS8|nr:hypothetical protein CERSUDRAFT_118469 [Gelatoporia subvermispora B]
MPLVDASHRSVCFQCHRSKADYEQPFSICSVCKRASYCSKECQKKHWKVHKLLCQPKGSKPGERPNPSPHLPADSPYVVAETDPNVHTGDEIRTEELRFCCLPASFADPSKNDPEGITECILYVGLKEAIFAQLGFPRPLPCPISPAHRIKSIPGAGLGIVASRDIKFTELICAERPLLLAPGAYMARNVPETGSMATRQQLAWQEYEDLIQCALNRMLPKNRETFMSLLNSHSKLGTPPLVGRMRTNGFNAGKEMKSIAPTMPEGDMGRYTAVGSTLSRLNHSCSPNGHVDFDPGTLSLQLTAMRDIAAGEQITISYCDVFLSQAERQKSLKRFDFTCTCRSCKNHKHSDKRRAQINANKSILDKSIFDWIEDPTLSDDYLEKKYLRLLDLMEQEGLQASTTYATCKEMLAKVYAALGDPERSVQYATEFISSQVPRRGGRWLPPEACTLAVDVTARSWLDQFWQKRVESCSGSGSGSRFGGASGSGSASGSEGTSGSGSGSASGSGSGTSSSRQAGSSGSR